MCFPFRGAREEEKSAPKQQSVQRLDEAASLILLVK
jgi:hypothetical protein